MKKILICLRRLCCQKNQVELTEENSAQQSQELFLERERLKPDLDDFTMGEYTEKVILYGFLMVNHYLNLSIFRIWDANFTSPEVLPLMLKDNC